MKSNQSLKECQKKVAKFPLPAPNDVRHISISRTSKENKNTTFDFTKAIQKCNV